MKKAISLILMAIVLPLNSGEVASGRFSVKPRLKVDGNELTATQLAAASSDPQLKIDLEEYLGIDLIKFLATLKPNQTISRDEVLYFKATTETIKGLTLVKSPILDLKCRENLLVLKSSKEEAVTDPSIWQNIAVKFSMVSPYTAAASAIVGFFQSRKENRAHEDQMAYFKIIDKKIDELLIGQRFIIDRLNNLVREVRSAVIEEMIDEHYLSINASMDRFYAKSNGRDCLTITEWNDLHTQLTYIEDKELRPGIVPKLIKQYEFALVTATNPMQVGLIKEMIAHRLEKLNVIMNNSQDETKANLERLSNNLSPQQVVVSGISLSVSFNHNLGADLNSFNDFKFTSQLNVNNTVAHQTIEKKCNEEISARCTQPVRGPTGPCGNNQGSMINTCIHKETAAFETEKNSILQKLNQQAQDQFNKTKETLDRANELNAIRAEVDKLKKFTPSLANNGKFCKADDNNLINFAPDSLKNKK